MSDAQVCPVCGSEIPAGSPGGMCPKCLLQGGLESNPPPQPGLAATAPSPQASPTGFVAPTAEELAARFPQLEIIELLGKGGMGAVYKARQRDLDRLVAVKILPPEVSGDPAFAERFFREARALARLSHPHIVAVHDIGRTADGMFYFIMEYVDGVNLRQTMHAGQLAPAEALRIVPQICDALQFAHDEGIVHRDIKPENILIDRRGRVKIADFGLAKLLADEKSDHTLTGTHQVMGTLRYMAPEQMEGSKEVDHRADIFSLGVVFYEMLTGQLPLGRFAPPSEKVQIDVRLDDVVLRTLAREPERRYQHASEVKTAVEDLSSGAAAPPNPAVAASSAAVGADVEPRLSRSAMWGAIWAPFGFLLPLLALGVVVPVFTYRSTRVDSVVQQRAVGDSGAEAMPTPSRPTAQEAMTPMWFGLAGMICAVPMALLGFTAPFGTTTLGIVAIGKIRCSKGRLYGLPLAVADSLLFPLLLLDVVLLALLLPTLSILETVIIPPPPNTASLLPALLTLLIGLPLSAWIDYLIVRKVWRAVTQQP